MQDDMLDFRFHVIACWCHSPIKGYFHCVPQIVLNSTGQYQYHLIKILTRLSQNQFTPCPISRGHIVWGTQVWMELRLGGCSILYPGMTPWKYQNLAAGTSSGYKHHQRSLEVCFTFLTLSSCDHLLSFIFPIALVKQIIAIVHERVLKSVTSGNVGHFPQTFVPQHYHAHVHFLFVIPLSNAIIVHFTTHLCSLLFLTIQCDWEEVDGQVSYTSTGESRLG